MLIFDLRHSVPSPREGDGVVHQFVVGIEDLDALKVHLEDFWQERGPRFAEKGVSHAKFDGVFDIGSYYGLGVNQFDGDSGWGYTVMSCSLTSCYFYCKNENYEREYTVEFDGYDVQSVGRGQYTLRMRSGICRQVGQIFGYGARRTECTDIIRDGVVIDHSGDYGVHNCPCITLVQTLTPVGPFYPPSDYIAKSAQRAFDATRSRAQMGVPSGIWSYLYQTALSDLSFEGYNITNLMQLSSIKDLMDPKAWAHLFDDGFVKGSANTWLTTQYSAKTTLSDLEELRRVLGLQRGPSTVCVRSGSVINGMSFHLKAVIKPQDGTGWLYRKLGELALLPNLGTLWDILPYSFVLDWIYPIQDGLKQLDDQWKHNECYYDVLSLVTSVKFEVPVQYPYWQGTVRSYARSVSDEPPEFVFYTQPPGKLLTLSHVATGASLIIQRSG